MKSAICRLLVPGFALSLAASLATAQSIDTFNPLPDSPPTTLAVQADGKLILAGNFLDIGTTARTRITRLNIDGSLDSTFPDPGVNGKIEAVAVQADGKILIGGEFTAINTTARHYLARLNANGTVDTTFADPNLNSYVSAIAVQQDGKALVVGVSPWPEPYRAEAQPVSTPMARSIQRMPTRNSIRRWDTHPSSALRCRGMDTC